MRWVFAAWALPMGIFWGWYFLSLNDMNFGYVMLTRQVHDLLFQLYGEMLGIEPATIPPLVAKACILDTLLHRSPSGRSGAGRRSPRGFGRTRPAAIPAWSHRRAREAGRARPAG